MDNGILYVQVQEELNSLLLHCLEAKDKVEVSRRFSHSQACIKAYFFQGSLKPDEVLRLQQLHSMRFLLQGKKAANCGDQQVTQAYSAVSSEINKLLGTVTVPKTPTGLETARRTQPEGAYDILMENYRHTAELPAAERLSKTIALIASIPQAFATDALMRKILMEPRQSESPIPSLDHSTISRGPLGIEDSEEDGEAGRSKERPSSVLDYRSEGLRRLLQSSPDSPQ